MDLKKCSLNIITTITTNFFFIKNERQVQESVSCTSEILHLNPTIRLDVKNWCQKRQRQYALSPTCRLSLFNHDSCNLREPRQSLYAL